MNQMCEKCSGAGEVDFMGLCGRNYGKATCDVCSGEKVITDDLLYRQARGEEIKTMRRELRILTRDAAAMFGCQASDWADFEHGRGMRDEIERAHAFILERFERSYLEWELVAHTSSDQRGTRTIEVFRNQELANDALRIWQGKTWGGVMAVYELKMRRVEF